MRCRDDQQFHFVRPVGVVAIRDIFNGETLLALDTLCNTVVLQPRPANDKLSRVQVSGDISVGVSPKDMKFSHGSHNYAQRLGLNEEPPLQQSKLHVDKSMIAIIYFLVKVRQANHSTLCMSHFRLLTFHAQ
jgi:hypothetical protein